MTTTLPGFFADRSLPRPQHPYRSGAFVPPQADRAIRLAQDEAPCRTSRTSANCRSCWSDCISGCDNVRDCFPSCRIECGGQPPDIPTGPCTWTDNSANHNLCVGGVTAWEIACKAWCGVVLGGAGFCIDFCSQRAAADRQVCPPAQICVL